MGKQSSDGLSRQCTSASLSAAHFPASGRSHVNSTRELLHLVEQKIALLDDLHLDLLS